uniref:ABM domain-containing protein n=1 Tax=Leptocylindrus danicus TaxID=163516 RepID=A0A7S2KWR8_9STRA|mmetsp:Transcript_28259/g.41585  ORF Transcript_28259/g.41585 Transcript_28259/m.41585 type:complete len:147 (+) Transcript_28259:93-533(+)
MKSFFNLLIVALSTSSAFAFVVGTSSANSFGTPTRRNSNMSTSALASKPFAVVVQAEIQPDRLEEFLDIIEKDAVGSRGEPGCIRFDVVQSQEDSNKFIFYEVYKDVEAVKFHKEQPHFALWTNFKESGGVVSSISHKMDGLFMSE